MSNHIIDINKKLNMTTTFSQCLNERLNAKLNENLPKERLKITDKFKRWYLVRIFALIFEFVRQNCILEGTFHKLKAIKKWFI